MPKPTAAQDLPSALDYLAQLETALEPDRTAVFLDYDGTLTPIVKRPQDAVLSQEMGSALQQLAALCPVAVISGRDRADVARRVGLQELIYAGSHGFDITGPAGLRMEYEGGKAALPALDKAETELRARVEPVAGAQVERKRFAIAVHYRNVAERDVGAIRKAVDAVAESHTGLAKAPGKKIIELKPAIDWHKGKAVLWLLAELGLEQSGLVPFYVGDDLTDEDAFRALGRRGIGILVGDHAAETSAAFRLEDVKEVKRFLLQLARLLRERSA